MVHWFQRVLALLTCQPRSGIISRKLQVIREAAKYEYPIGDMAEILANIEAGYTQTSQSLEK